MASQKARVATMWLGGCSGCHMSFLDQDELLIDLSEKMTLVHSPIMDVKTFPENVAVTLVEGAVNTEDQLAMLKKARKRTKLLVSLGDCAVTGNVTALRNAETVRAEGVLKRSYVETADIKPQIPIAVPKLVPKARPLHEIVKVDYFITGCPPNAGLIYYVLTELLAGRATQMEINQNTAKKRL
jgi:NAD-reducing hydrogenase small subunit